MDKYDTKNEEKNIDELEQIILNNQNSFSKSDIETLKNAIEKEKDSINNLNRFYNSDKYLKKDE